MHKINKSIRSMGTAIAAIVLAIIAKVCGICDEDVVPLEAEPGQLPAFWNIGTIDHMFVDSVHLRGVASVRDYNITGLDTITSYLHFCPMDMTIYGNVTVGRLQLIGNYTSIMEYMSEGSVVHGHADGFVNLTFTNLHIRDLVAPIRYSASLQRLQFDRMQYEVHEDIENPLVTGLELDDGGWHNVTGEEFVRVDQTSSFPSAIEIVRAVLNARIKRRIREEAVKKMFAGAFSLRK